MARRTALVFVFLMAGALTASDTAAQKKGSLGDLIAKAGTGYTKLNDTTYETIYKGKNVPNLTVRIATAEGGLFYFVPLFERKNLALPRAMLLKIAELNSTYDYVKIALSEETLLVRMDTRLRVIDLEEFKFLENQIASAADEIYLVLKDFIG